MEYMAFSKSHNFDLKFDGVYLNLCTEDECPLRQSTLSFSFLQEKDGSGTFKISFYDDMYGKVSEQLEFIRSKNSNNIEKVNLLVLVLDDDQNTGHTKRFNDIEINQIEFSALGHDGNMAPIHKVSFSYKSLEIETSR